MDEIIIENNASVYLPSDIARMLSISRTMCYAFLNEAYKNNGPFKVIKINKSIRVPKEGFDEWLNKVS